MLVWYGIKDSNPLAVAGGPVVQLLKPLACTHLMTPQCVAFFGLSKTAAAMFVSIYSLTAATVR